MQVDNDGMVMVAGLKVHPLNQAIYGEEPTDQNYVALQDSIRRHGILTPLLVAKDGTIISGHRRFMFARYQGIPRVPVAVFRNTDPLLIEQALIHANRQRVKTPEQIGRELKCLKKIEAELAKRRQAAAAARTHKELGRKADKEMLRENSHEASGRADERAAAQLGLSAHTARRMEIVVDAIDEAEESGDEERAEELREALNTKSVKAAYELVRPPEVKATKPKPAPQTDSPGFLDVEEQRLLDEGKAWWAKCNTYVHAAFLEWAETASRGAA